MHKTPSFVFFGTPQFAVTILNELEKKGLIPSLIITQEDKPRGRHLSITPPEVKVWAIERGIEIFQPKTLKDGSCVKYLKDRSPKNGWDVFVVASYGKIIPEEVLSLPHKGTLNVHPSLLPKLRGSSPIEGAILNEEKTGVSIMLLDKEMDHGPILAQKEVPIQPWPPYAPELENTLAQEGGSLLAEILPRWINGSIEARDQDHSNATYTEKTRKEDAYINLTDAPELNLKKIKAYSGWPNAYTFFTYKEKELRLIIKSAHIENDTLILDTVIPEGKKEMPFKEFEKRFLPK